MIPFLKVLHTNNSESISNFPLTPYVLSLQISKGSEATKNSLTLELSNICESLNSQIFEVNDSVITIYLDWNPITTQDPVMVGTISSIGYPMTSEGKYKIKLKCTDKSAMLLNKIWAESITRDTTFDAPYSTNNAPNAIRNLVGHLNGLDGTTVDDMTTNNVASTRSDGTAFPTGIEISKIWKPGWEWLNELSQPEFTQENRPYVYYVDASNDLHWHYPFQKSTTYLTSDVGVSDTTINVSSTSTYPDTGYLNIEEEVIYYSGKTTTSFTGCLRGQFFTTATTHASGLAIGGLILYPGKQDIYEINIDTTEDLTYNFIIYNGGPTPAEYEYLDYTLDESQVGKKFKMKFVKWDGVAKDMTNREKGRSEWGTDKTTNYPMPGGNPLGPANTYTTLWADTVTSDDEYQESFILEVKKRCETKAKAYFVTGTQKYKGNVQMRGTLNYEVNDLVTVYNEKFNKILLLRVKDIKHQLNNNSWITDIELQEDVDVTSTTID